MNFSIENFIPPDNESLKLYSACGCHSKVETPSLIELELASRKHRWKEMNELMNQFLMACADKVIEYEKDLLKLFNMPSIDEVHELIRTGEGLDRGTKLVIKPSQFKTMNKIFDEWRIDLLGKPPKKDLLEDEEGMPIVEYFIVAGFALGVAKTLAQIALELEEEEIAALEATRIVATPKSRYLYGVWKKVSERVGDKLSVTRQRELFKALGQMASKNLTTKQGAILLDRVIGQNNLWHWNRITRSEMTLAVNASFSEQAKASGIEYERWSAGPGACWICSGFAGQYWKLDEGPQPISDSHPHCLCTRDAFFKLPEDAALQQPWSRPTPYDQPYTPEEQEEFRQRFGVAA